MTKNNNQDNYQYLLKLYSIVNGYLSDTKDNRENLAEIVVSFCTVSEKIFKIKLYDKNPVLVFDIAKLKDCDQLATIVNREELDVETIKSREAIDRFRIIFKNKFSDSEMQALIDMYKVRNCLIHGYKSDNDILSEEDNIIKKMGTVWGKISEEVTLFFGSENIKVSKPAKKYTEKELENVLTEEVRKKIKDSRNLWNNFSATNLVHASMTKSFNPFMYAGEQCPRCGAYGFSSENSLFEMPQVYINSGISDLYKCKECNLELTKKEFEIAKKINSNSV